MEPLVSIIVPVYNVPERYLKACIESLINQTIKEIEIIIVDDGSKDNSGAICDMYAGKDSRIKVIHKKNGGLAAARNTGFRAAAGEYITFVDGDDWIDKNMCEVMYSAAKDNKVDLVMCGVVKEYAQTSEIYKFEFDDMQYFDRDGCKYLQSKLLVYSGNIATAYAKLIRRAFLLEHGIEHDAVLRQGLEGLEFNMRLFDKLEGALFVKQPFYHYIYNENSISAYSTEGNNKAVLKGLQKIKEYINTSDNKELLIENYYNRILYIIVTTAISSYFHPANNAPYKERVEGFKAFLSSNVVLEALQNAKGTGISFSRKFVLFCSEHKLYIILNFMGVIRKRQKILR